jgi:hypothetical protein
MGREVRRVPKDWRHPIDENTGRLRPLSDGYAHDAAEFLAKANAEGLQAAVDYFGRAPNAEDYMPDWPETERTHLMMYENTSEGTPISPAFETPEELARWLADNKASAFGSMTATYEQWLSMAKAGWAPSMIATVSNGKCALESGVASTK